MNKTLKGKGFFPQKKQQTGKYFWKCLVLNQLGRTCVPFSRVRKSKYWTFKILHVIRKNLTLPVHSYLDLIQWNLQEELGDSFKWIYLHYCEYRESEAQLRSKFFLAVWVRFNSLSNLTPNLLACHRLFCKWLLCHWSAGKNDSEIQSLLSCQ